MAPRSSAAIKKMLHNVLEEITPDSSTKKEVLAEVNSFVEKLNASLKKKGIKAKAVLGGSYAKDSWLKGDYDVDMFVLFDLAYKDKDLSKLLARALAPWKPDRVHGSRDYFQIKNTVNYEIIPVLNIKKASDAQNVTDFSPLHVKWVQKEGKKYKDDIRLFKRFCKANKVYGAESYIRGISGHVADILVIHYKGFLPLLRAITKWKPKVVIDTKKAYKKNPLLILNTSKTEGPLLVIDPVQPDRNAAAAFTEEKLGDLIKAASAFVKAPSKKHFVDTSIEDTLAKKKKPLLVVHSTALKGKQDVSGAKLLKVFTFLKQQLADFGLKDAGWEWDGSSPATMWFALKKDTLPKQEVMRGPPKSMENHAKRFKKAHKKTIVKGKYLYATITRKQTKAETVLQSALRNKYVRERTKTCRLLKY